MNVYYFEIKTITKYVMYLFNLRKENLTLFL